MASTRIIPLVPKVLSNQGVISSLGHWHPSRTYIKTLLRTERHELVAVVLRSNAMHGLEFMPRQSLMVHCVHCDASCDHMMRPYDTILFRRTLIVPIWKSIHRS
jgi:hypothetical protein